MDLDSYDRAVGSIYDAALDAGALGGMFEQVCVLLGAEATGVSVYDDADSVITHTLIWPRRPVTGELAAQIRSLNEDAVARLVTGARLHRASRFSDIVPPERLRHARWFRAQNDLTGLGPGMAADAHVAGIRVRLFAMRGAARANFDGQQVELLGRLVAHLRRAFAQSVGLLSPRTVPDDLHLVLYYEDRLASPFLDKTAWSDRMSKRFGLTPAEARVLAVMAGGSDRRAGAAALDIGLNSLKSHMRRIYAKTGTRRLPELLVLLQDARQA